MKPDRRRQILDAALGVFAERGYNGASIALVAERVGLTPQGVLHYFPTKRELLTGALELRDQYDIDVLLATEAEGGTITAFLRELVARNSEQPGIVQSFTVLAAESVTENHPAADFFRRRYATGREFIGPRLRPEDHPEDLTPQQATTMMAAVVDGLQVQWLLEPDAIDMPQLVNAFLKLMSHSPEPA